MISVEEMGFDLHRTNIIVLVCLKMITGNTDANSVVTYELEGRLEAKVIRLWPIKWSGKPCMRAEIYGCEGLTVYFNVITFSQCFLVKSNIPRYNYEAKPKRMDCNGGYGLSVV